MFNVSEGNISLQLQRFLQFVPVIDRRELPTNSYCAYVASRGSYELSSECCNRGQMIFMRNRFSNRRSCSVNLCGFHFTITAVTVDWGSSSRADIWPTDLLERWHPVTVPHWVKSLSSSVRPFYWQCLSMEIAWLCVWFYAPVSNWWTVAEMSESTNLKACPHTFAYLLLLFIFYTYLTIFWGKAQNYLHHLLQNPVLVTFRCVPWHLWRPRRPPSCLWQSHLSIQR